MFFIIMQNKDNEIEDVESFFYSKELEDLIDKENISSSSRQFELDENLYCLLKDKVGVETKCKIISCSKNKSRKKIKIITDSNIAGAFLSDEDFEIYIILKDKKLIFNNEEDLYFSIRNYYNYYIITLYRDEENEYEF